MKWCTIQVLSSGPPVVGRTDGASSRPLGSFAAPQADGGLDGVEDIHGGAGDARARPEDGGNASFSELRKVVLGNHAADNDDDVARAGRLELGDELRDKGDVRARLRRDADGVDVGVDGLPRHLGGEVEERADVDVVAQVRKARRYHVGAAVVAVHADLCDEDARPPAVELLERGDAPPRLVHLRELLRRHRRRRLGGVGADAERRGRRVLAEDVAERVGDFAQGGAAARGRDGQRQEVALVVSAGRRRAGEGQRRRLAQRLQRRLHGARVALLLQRLEADELRGEGGVGLDGADVKVLGIARSAVRLGDMLVDADDDVDFGVDARLLPRRRVLKEPLRRAGLDHLPHAAGGVDVAQDAQGLVLELRCERLHKKRAAPGVGDGRQAGLVLQDELRRARDSRRRLGRQADGLVKGVCVQRLRPAVHRRHRFERRPRDVVQRLGLRQRVAARLAVRAQQHGLFGHVWEALLQELGPERSGAAQFCHLDVVLHARGEEEGHAPCDGVDVEARVGGGAQILEAVRQSERHLQRRVGAGLVHVVARDGDGVELRHVVRREAHNVGDDSHARRGRVDVRVADHKLLQNVVLHRPPELRHASALLLGGDDEHGQRGQHGAVDGHAHGHGREVDAVEQNLNVLDAVDGHAGEADVALSACVVRVVPAVRREIEGDGEALLARGDVCAVKRVALLGRREAGVLAHRPRPDGVHRRVGPARKREDARRRRWVWWCLGVHRQNLQALGRKTRQRLDAAAGAAALPLRRRAPPRVKRQPPRRAEHP
mmetsp:Transcript_26611/g.94952  ORF Transcript_26611/g.94952 Transcript_26611/m.94952 type:complete len:774 (+) Transcript_26611:108-2429(+)